MGVIYGQVHQHVRVISDCRDTIERFPMEPSFSYKKLMKVSENQRLCLNSRVDHKILIPEDISMMEDEENLLKSNNKG